MRVTFGEIVPLMEQNLARCVTYGVPDITYGGVPLMDTIPMVKYRSFAGAAPSVPLMEVCQLWRGHLWRDHCTVIASEF